MCIRLENVFIKCLVGFFPRCEGNKLTNSVCERVPSELCILSDKEVFVKSFEITKHKLQEDDRHYHGICHRFYFLKCDNFLLSLEMNKCQNFLFDITLKDKLNYPNGEKDFMHLPFQVQAKNCISTCGARTHTFH